MAKINKLFNQTINSPSPSATGFHPADFLNLADAQRMAMAIE